MVVLALYQMLPEDPRRAGHGDSGRTPSHRQRLLKTAVSLQLRLLIRLYLKKEDFFDSSWEFTFLLVRSGKWFPWTIPSFTLRSRSKDRLELGNFHFADLSKISGYASIFWGKKKLFFLIKKEAALLYVLN
jgi:hypothetical protein